MNESHRTLSVAPTPGGTSDTSARSLPPWAAPAALGAILLLAAILYGWALGSLGWGNGFYSAAVKSMGKSWTNFLFGSYDPAGVVTVDKPPAALWPQVISSKIFGLHGWALILPQMIEGVAGVFVLHRTVRRWAGEQAALLAALVLTLTPITVAINRDNNPDTLLVLLLVAAAYALTRALQTEGRAATWWLCASGFLIGCGFLTKMLAAWMVVPSFTLAWLMAGSGTWAARVGRLLGAGAVLVASSLWWVAMVALWPGDRPYIGGSDDGSAWNLVVGYNGLGRVFGSSGDSSQPSGVFGGEAGLGRMFNSQVGGQISWLLPACAVALAIAVLCTVLHRRGRLDASGLLPASGWLLWGTWLIVCVAVFSKQSGIFHPYYTTQLAPAVAALCGGMLAALIRVHRAGVAWAPWASAGAVAVTVGWAMVLIRRTPDWNGWLIWPVVLIGCAAIALLLTRRGGKLLLAGVAAAVVSMLAAPGAWAASASASASSSLMGGANPTAGPNNSLSAFGISGMRGQGSSQMPSGIPSGVEGFPSGGSGTGQQGEQPTGGMPSGMPSGLPSGMSSGGQGGMPSGFPGGIPSASGGSGSGSASGGQEMPSLPSGSGGMSGGSSDSALTSDQRKVLDYAVKHSPKARIKLAVSGGAQSTNAFILNSDETVIGMGGFIGSDNAPSVAQLKKWTKDGELRYILGSDTSSNSGAGAMMVPGMSQGSASVRSAWISKNCTKVSASAYGGSQTSRRSTGSAALFGASVLYDCASR
ncbi:glycosyltransferase family 39 protein [Streptomyces sp. NPDC096057]|uniref:ArnT family glycosyltransferase n=1 Tax=Streptomyces sp. NPDC096057 TaxID=3155543 RepID=UPI00332F8AEA